MSSSATTPYTFQHALEAIKGGEPIVQAGQKLLSELTEAERLSLLDGDTPFWEGMHDMFCDRYNRVPYIMGSIPRLGIPGVRFADGPRGIVMNESTAFPVSMARGATWDTSLERRVGDAIGLEAKAQGANYFGGICVNLPRHPAWGRIQETYGEDPLLLGEFGLALTESVQKHVMACVKHYALNSMENARFRVDVELDEDVLHEVYLPHFKKIVEGGVASVMSSYNSVNGEWAGQNNHLLNEILRDQWGFDGFVLSDFVFGLRDAALSVKNGLDIEAPFSQQRNMHLKDALASGELAWSDVDRACLRILHKELEFEVKTEASQPAPSVIFSKEHRALAREVSQRSMVLLKNDKVDGNPLLPLHAPKLSKIAIVGRLANSSNTGDKGSSQVFSPHVVTPFEGLKAVLPNVEIILDDSDSVERAQELASKVDLVICIVGYNDKDEGEYLVDALEDNPPLLKVFPPAKTAKEKEALAIIQGNSTKGKSEGSLEVGAGGDRKSLRLREQDEKLIDAVAARNPRTVVSIITAGAVIMEAWKDKVPAIIMSWYSGSDGGPALADVLFGQVDASGRLPFSIPKDEAHLPFFDREATKIRYDRWLGQHLLDKLNVQAAFPLGFGLSYTTFSTANLRVDEADIHKEKDEMLVRFSVSNTGSRGGRYIAQIYGLPGLDNFPSRVLLGFTPVDLDAGQSKDVAVSVSLRPLQRWVNGTFKLPGKDVGIELASFAGDSSALNMSSCFGFRKSRTEEREPLLPQYRDDTTMQGELHQNLHTYQMLRAFSRGFMPSNEQTIANLRTFLAADILNPENQDLSDSGRALVHYLKTWLNQFIELLQHKNEHDQIQDFIWYLTHAKVSVDYEDIAQRAAKSKSKADAAVGTVHTIKTMKSSLLLTNSDFRIFLSDLSKIGREVFKDTAFTLSEVSQEAGRRLGPSKEDQGTLKESGAEEQTPPSVQNLGNEVSEVSKVIAESGAKVAEEAEHSFADRVSSDEKATLLHRLKEAVTNLRKRTDYSDSVSTLSLLLKRYAITYSHIVENTMETVEDDVNSNPETERAVRNFWTFLKSFGVQKEWQELERRFKKIMEHGKSDPQFDELIRQTGNALQDMFTDPGFFDHAEERFQDLRTQSHQLTSNSSLREDIDGLLAQLQSTFHSVLQDQDIAKLIQTSTRIAKILSPTHQYTNGELITDSINVFVPLLVQAIQYIPIPRLEIATPEIDLLLENLILEPGTTVNHTSFLPYRLRVETRNDLEIRKARFRTTSSTQSLVTIKIDGLSIRANEIGYWLRTHSSFLRLIDEGIASFQLDERGVDIHIDVEIGKEKLEKILSLRSVKVHIHKLNYTLRKSKFAFCAWLFKPLIRPIIRKAMEIQIAHVLADGLHAANRELLFARERLRATRISNPDDLWTFLKAVGTRLVPEQDPDLYTRVGIAQSGKGAFKGRYAPGSLVKLWNEEAALAPDRIRENEQDGWRNTIFDVHGSEA
ncbi:hypothetical protein B7463_g11144, partial [Scytalidium lignicola]